MKLLNRLSRISQKISSNATANSNDCSSDVRPELPSLPALHADLTDAEQSRIEELAFRFGHAPESYDVAHPSSHVLSSPCGQGILHLHADRRTWHFPGGIIADDGHKPSIVQWLRRLAVEQRRTVAIYSVNAEEVPLFREAGFAVNKLGEEAVLDLPRLDWRGKPFAWVRRQTNFCKNNQLQIIEVTSRREQLVLSEELMFVFFDDLRDRVYSKPLRLLEGKFDPRSLGRRRLFIAFHPVKQRIEGFLVASPLENGAAWAFETYRKRRDATRGTIPFLFREITDRLQCQGARSVSLCLVPGRGVHLDRAAEADARVRFLLGMWYGRLNILFNAAGQEYFKSRFRPRYTDRFVCVYPRNTMLSIASFLKTSGALDVNFKNLMTEVWSTVRRVSR